MKRTVLVLSNAEDDSTHYVTKELETIGTSYVRFNTELFPAEASLVMQLNDSSENGSLQLPDLPKTNLRDVQSVWYRRPVAAWLPETMHSGYIQFVQRESGAALWSLYTNMDAFWMNPPLWSSKLLESNKLYQLKVAKEIGLRVPDTVIGNDPQLFFELAERHGGRIAAKPLRAGAFTKEGDPHPHFLFTQVLSTCELHKNCESIRICPLIGQEYIRKEIEFRVTIVGEKVFACAIHSQDSPHTEIDWRRYDFTRVKHEVWQLPAEIELKLAAYLKRLNLTYGAVDIILTPEGEYVFLEINANGQWVWIEELTGMPISRSMAEMLSFPPGGLTEVFL